MYGQNEGRGHTSLRENSTYPKVLEYATVLMHNRYKRLAFFSTSETCSKWSYSKIHDVDGQSYLVSDATPLHYFYIFTTSYLYSKRLSITYYESAFTPNFINSAFPGRYKKAYSRHDLTCYFSKHYPTTTFFFTLTKDHEQNPTSPF